MKKNDSFLPILFRVKFKIFKQRNFQVFFKQNDYVVLQAELICKTYAVGHRVWLTSASTSIPASQIHRTLQKNARV